MKHVENIIVGTGISSLGAAYILKSKKKKFKIFEAGSKNKISPKKIYFDKDGTPKKLNKSNHLDILTNKMFGGNSMIWGANCMRLFKEQFNEWPLKYKSFSKFYNLAEKILHVIHFKDIFSSTFRINKFNNNYKKYFDPFLIDKVAKKKSNKFKIGLTRLATSKNLKLFNTRNWFDENLKKEILFNSEVVSFKNEGKKIKVFFKNNKQPIYCQNLFLCAGAISSSKILINSFKNLELEIKESTYFITPCIFKNKKKNSFITKNTSQLQIYSKDKIYSELKYDPFLLNAVLKKKFNFFSKLIPKNLINQIYILTGFLPDTYSRKTLVIKKEKNNKSNKFLLTWKNKKKQKNAKNLLNLYIDNLSKELEFRSLPWLTKIYDRGRSYHLGSSTPMTSKKDKGIHTNINGELNLSKNVYLCDSSNFPNIPSSSIGLTILANSMRIVDKVK